MEVLSIPLSYVFSAELNPEGTLEGWRYVAATDLVKAGVWDLTTERSIGSLE